MTILNMSNGRLLSAQQAIGYQKEIKKTLGKTSETDAYLKFEMTSYVKCYLTSPKAIKMTSSSRYKFDISIRHQYDRPIWTDFMSI